MKANELRLGNLVQITTSKNTSIIEVRKLCALNGGFLINDESPIIFEPIPLTEEWVLKFGFKERKTFIGIEFTNGMFLCYKKKKISLESVSSDILMFDIKYVHKLQNLYFSLTGEELKIK